MSGNNDTVSSEIMGLASLRNKSPLTDEVIHTELLTVDAISVEVFEKRKVDRV